MNILLLGPQGSGKGTQAKRIAENYGLAHIATGEMLRRAIAAETPFGLEVKPIVESGALVPDELMIDLIRERLDDEDTREGFILDGFPRTMAQALALDRMLAEIGRELDIVFELQVSDEVCIERLAQACARGRPQRRHARGDRAPARGLSREDRAAGRLLPRSRKPCRDPRRPSDRRGLRGDRGGPTDGGGSLVIIRKSPQEIERMARAGRVVAETHALVGDAVRPGVTTGELDELAEEFIRSQGGVPTFLGYKGFPASLCLSPNDMVVHGIPGPYRLEEGDILSVDVGVTLDGFVADAAYTHAVGQVSDDVTRLLEIGQEALAAGVAQARAGNRLSDISHAVQTVTEAAGYSVIRSLVGHGVGRSMHEDPQIPNFGEPGRGPLLQPGMTLAIEPMINAGGPEIYLHDDAWSISTADGSLSCHFEHTVAVTESGPRILTQVNREPVRQAV